MPNLEFYYFENMMHGLRLGGLTLVCKSLGFNISTMTRLWNLAAARNGATRDEVQNAPQGLPVPAFKSIDACRDGTSAGTPDGQTFTSSSRTNSIGAVDPAL